MNEEKNIMIENTVNNFVKLPQEKKMYVLGFMQGVLVNKNEKQESEEHKNL